MINALFSSKSGGTKLFQHGKDRSPFGWTTIVDMYKRDVNRARQQQTRMIPRLKEVHVLRDSWTKLNVSPAKIMQVFIVFVVQSDMFLFTIARASIDRALCLYTSRPSTSRCSNNHRNAQVSRGMQQNI